MIANQSRQITLLQFSATFIPFGLLLAGALVWAEMGNDLVLERVNATIWSTSILLNLALVISPFRMVSHSMSSLVCLYWSFAWLIFLTHACRVRWIAGIHDRFARCQNADSFAR
jgi:hypothetical protein